MSAPVDFEIEIDSPSSVEVEVNAIPEVTVALGGPTVVFAATPGPPGQTGPRGASGSGAQIYGETPAGTQDGVNETFTLANTFQAGSTSVYRNGLREKLGICYTESSPDITFTTAPLSNDVLEVDYLIA